MTKSATTGKKTRKQHTPEFRDEALKLAERIGVAAAARQLSLHESLLYTWRSKLQQHLDRLSSIESLALPEGIDRTIHQNQLLKLAREGRKMSCRDLTRFSAPRRHAILVCVLEEARATLTDEVIELHERMLNSLFSKAKRTQAERLQQTGKLIQSKLRQYIDVG